MSQASTPATGAASAAPAWHALSVEETLSQQSTDAERGLAASEVTSRRTKFGSNKLAEAAREPRLQAFLRQYRDPMQVVLLIAGTISLFLPGQFWTGVALIFLTLLNAFMGLPPVVVGLVVYLMLSRAGPLGALGLLFTPAAMVVAQAVLVLPIVAALTRQTIEDAWGEYDEQLRSLGAGPGRAMWTLLWDTRFSLLTAVLAGFGRAVAEVGAVMIVGGNIDGVTRVMTTTIALETSKGDLLLALALGIILLTIVLVVNAGAYVVKETAQRVYG
jgi:tungstate transport system permease protein